MKMWLVGAGYWGKKLALSLDKFEITTNIIDIRNGQSIEDIDSLDPVILATPLWQHHDQTCRLLSRGHDVYVEKPMVETANQISSIRNYLRPDQILMVGHLFVHHPQMIAIRSMLDSGTIGDVLHIHSQRLNWGIYQTKTDPLLSLATHDITIIETLAQSQLIPESARAWNYSHNVQPDRVWFSGSTPIGTTFDVDVSWHWPIRVRKTVIVGSHGQMTWDQDANSITVSRHMIVNNRAVIDSNVQKIDYDFAMSPLEMELKHWIDCVRSRTQPITGIDAAESVAVAIDKVKNLL